MNLQSAYRKFIRGHLSCSQPPVIAEQSLTKGFESPSLLILASEYEPAWATVAPLFEASMQELKIEIPLNLALPNLEGAHQKRLLPSF